MTHGMMVSAMSAQQEALGLSDLSLTPHVSRTAGPATAPAKPKEAPVRVPPAPVPSVPAPPAVPDAPLTIPKERPLVEPPAPSCPIIRPGK